MSYLLDTCILSKLRKLKKYPDKKLENWLSKHKYDSFFVSALTIGEIQTGISKLSPSNSSDRHSKAILEDWFHEELLPRFNERILIVDVEIVMTWGRLSGENQRKGIMIPVVDGLIAATALTHNLTMVTDNINDFNKTGVRLFNPWE